MTDYRIGSQVDHDHRHYSFARRYPLGLSRSPGWREWLHDHADAIVLVSVILFAVIGLVVAK
jgi:hypothetical protein